MRYSTSGMVLAAVCLGEAVAGPAHAHLHQRVHQKKNVDWAALDWNNMGIDWSKAYEEGQATKTSAAAVAATTAPAVATVAAVKAATTAAAVSTSSTTTATSAVESVVGSIANDLQDLWDGLVGASNYRTSFGESTQSSGSTGDNYYGNVGAPYGSNVIKVDSTTGYDFTNTFHNSQSKTITINIWQKVGPDGEPLSGSALAPKNTTLTFALAAGASQTVAIQGNTQIAWAEACSDFAASGAYAITWGEANFVSSGSGYDVSAIMNANGNNYDMTITSVEAASCKSSRTENMWLTATDPVGGSDGSCYIAQSTATLTTVMGGFVSS